MGPVGTQYPAGTMFDFNYQANIVAFNDVNGTPISAPAGLNASWELTYVAILPEVQVTAAAGFPSSVTFATTGPGQWAMYYDDATIGGTQKSDIALGTGFNDGILIASGTWFAPKPSGVFSASSPTEGFGGTNVKGPVNFINPAFFTNLVPAITQLDFNGTLTIPVGNAATASFFDGNDGFAIAGVAANDLLFRVDGSNGFETIPEPSTYILLGIALGAVGFARKKMNIRA
jgi:hypothetical protein